MTSSIEQKYDFLFKILLVGNSSVGKSSLFLRFVDDIWNETFVPTIGVDFKIKTIEVEKKNVKLQIWDTAGEERFRTIISSYYKGAHGILLMFDVTDYDSFESLENWLIEIEKNANKSVIKLLIGNKIDLEENRKVSYNQAKDFADSNGIQYIETSVKLNTNVNQAFWEIGKELMNATKDKEFLHESNKKTITISKNANNINEEPKNKGGCCG
jgi:Ras-related protein Rab-1A